MNGSVSSVIGGIEELITLAFQELLDDLDVFVLNGVTEGCECGFYVCETGRGVLEWCGRVREGRMGDFGEFAAERLGE